MPIAAGILDARSHKVVHINSSLSKLLSLEPEDIVGKTPSEFGVIEDMDVDGALRLLPDSHPSLCTRTRVRRPDGTIRTYGLELLRISVEEGHFTFFIAHDLENASSTARSQGC
jgi:PAS domain-containing protein